MLDTPALVGRVAARYRDCGRFAFHYVAGKLKRDPLTRALLALGAAEGFGDVADLGCGRGQFAALLLDAGLARTVIGLEANAALLRQAQHALRGLPFESRLQDLAADPLVPPVDTVLMLDMLYQLPTQAQEHLLATAAVAARRNLVIRSANPAQNGRAWVTKSLELMVRSVWPHSGAMVNARPIGWIAAQLHAQGFAVQVVPCWAGTPFGNVLLTATRGSGAGTNSCR